MCITAATVEIHSSVSCRSHSTPTCCMSNMLLQSYTHYNQELSNQLDDSQEQQRGVVEGGVMRRIAPVDRPQSRIFLVILNH